MSVDYQTMISPCDSQDTLAASTEPFQPGDLERLLESRRYWLEQYSSRYNRRSDTDTGSRSSRSSVASLSSSLSVVMETPSSTSTSTSTSTRNGSVVKIMINESLLCIPLCQVDTWLEELGYNGESLTIAHLICYLKFSRELPNALNQIQLLHMGQLYRYNNVNVQLESLNLNVPMTLRINEELPPIMIPLLACLAGESPRKLLWIGRFKTKIIR